MTVLCESCPLASCATRPLTMSSCDDGAMDSGEGVESLDGLFCEIWERESQSELRFPITGVGSVLQTQDLQGARWEVNNFSNTVWEAAIWMHHFFQDQRCFPAGWLRGRRVLEVGAGTGLVGLSLALLGAEVTMTDLPEALPILRHNAEATFGALNGDNGYQDGRHALNNGKSCRRPMILPLCWGDKVQAREVAAAAAAAAAAEAEGERDTEWRGFDMIVGADVIYNEPTFPALTSTLSDRHLCSDKTLVYLATMLRGGRHEGLLEMLNGGGFQVRALDPASANDLRARVVGDCCADHRSGSCARSFGGSGGGGGSGDDGVIGGSGGAGGCCRSWPGPEWRRESFQEKRKIELVRVPSPADDDNREGVRPSTRTDSVTSGTAGGDSDHVCDSEAGDGGGHEGVVRSSASAKNAREVRNANAAKGEGGGSGGIWGYKEQELGKILAFVARRRVEDALLSARLRDTRAFRCPRVLCITSGLLSFLNAQQMHTCFR